MALTFREVRCEVNDLLIEADFELPGGIVVGVSGVEPAELQLLIDLASGAITPEEGEIERDTFFCATPTFHSADVETIEFWTDAALESGAGIIAIGPSLALTSPVYRAFAASELHRIAREGTLVLLISQDLRFLADHSDEALLIDEGAIALRGEPRETITRYREMLIDALREEADEAGLLDEFPRHGDQRAELTGLDLIDDEGKSTAMIQSGEQVAIEVKVRFEQAVEEPVVGILLRNRIGVSVYGTNTQLEGIRLGPKAAGDEATLRFSFRADLCPQEYTITAASHDPDGTAHDWLEEALLFTVMDARHTEGVANLRAKVEVVGP